MHIMYAVTRQMVRNVLLRRNVGACSRDMAHLSAVVTVYDLPGGKGFSPWIAVTGQFAFVFWLLTILQTALEEEFEIIRQKSSPPWQVPREQLSIPDPFLERARAYPQNVGRISDAVYP